MGVSQSIADGLMGRCEMVWTTAGTNRVCGRCLELKDRVVGHTDESRVTIPPLHPRCRCAIMYREVGTPRVMQPKPKPNNFEPSFVSRSYKTQLTNYTLHEFIEIARNLIPTIENYTGQKSKWIGQIMLNARGESRKPWECYILLDEKAPVHVLIHELIHSCSASIYGWQAYIANKMEEELTVHYLSQELAVLKSFPVVGSGYDTGVNFIRNLKKHLHTSKPSLEFASDLVKQPLGQRWDWLEEQIRESLGLEATIEHYQRLMSKLERIRQWGIKQK